MGLYGSSKAPAAPDPAKTAAAQTNSNIATAQANAIMGNVNQVTPDGNLTYTQSGQQFVSDPTSGTMYYRGPNGEISTTRPTTTGASTTRQVPIYEKTWNDNGKALVNKLTGYRTETVPGGTTAAEGWSELGKGYYIPQYTATQTLSPQQQAIKDQEDAASLNLAKIANDSSSRIGGLLGTQLDISKLPAAGDPSSLKAPTYTKYGSGPQLQTSIADAGSILREFGDAGAITKTYGNGDYETGRKTVEDAMFARLNPQIEQQRSALETSLANQGIRVGSTAYAAAMDDFNRGLNDQRTSVTLAGGQEQSRLAGLDQARATFENGAQQQTYDQLLGRATFTNQAQAQQFAQNAAQAQFSNNAKQQGYQNETAATEANNGLLDREFSNAGSLFNVQNTARQNALNEATALRQMPINEISALMSGAQVQQPNFVNANMPTIANTDYAGLVQSNYQAKLAQWQQQQANQNSMIGGLFGLGATAIMASDRRLKTDVRAIGAGPLGLVLYAFRYVWGGPMQIGVMAQDVARVLPEAVVTMANGFLAVDYGKLFARGS